jgi:hypothetical protein
MLTRNARPALILVAAVTLAALFGGAARGTTAPAPTAKVSKIKQIQRRMITEEARKYFRQRRQALLRGLRPESRLERARDEGLAQGEDLRRERLARMTESIREFRTQQALATNVRANDPSTDVVTCPPGGACSTQGEESIAAWHQYVLVAWNDGEHACFPENPTCPVQGYGFSSDSGATFTDGGVPPQGTNWTWVSDPVVTVNEKTGVFYFVALVDSGGPANYGAFNGIGIVSATFSGGSPVWGAPVMVRKADANLLVDKPWAVADSASDSLYISYTTFTVFGYDHIQFQRSPNGVNWTPAVTLSSGADSGYVQGSRPAVGPDGEVYVVWSTAGPIDVDWFRIRKSTNAGGTFAAQVTMPVGGNPASGYYGNWGTGAPGFNRERGVTYPSIAVDRSSGPFRGRVYVTWNESINFYDDGVNSGIGPGAVSEPAGESGLNDTPATATQFTVNNTLRGTVGSSTDFDYWKFQVPTVGTTGVFYMDLVDSGVASPTLDPSFRLFCTDGTTRLGFSNFGVGGVALIVFTFPEAGTYYLRCAGFDGTTGKYRIRTKFSVTGPERARDHRDIFITSSNNGTTWTTPVRVNPEAGMYDDWLPEVAVSGQGRPFVSWYDWHDSPAGRCGGLSHVYIARSDDGGANWISLGQVSSAQSDWTNSLSYLAPNQGDYMGLYANANGVYPAWADVRSGDPDVFTSYLTFLVTPVQASLVSAVALRDRVTLTWYASEAEGFPAAVYRRTEGTDWAVLDRLDVPANGRIVYVDSDVTPGASYQYRVGIVENGAEKLFGDASVTVPRFDLEIASVAPNPAYRDLWVSFTLPVATPATLRLIDVAGREVRRREVGTTVGPQRVNLAEGHVLPMGVYAVQLTQGARTVTTRVSVVR